MNWFNNWSKKNVVRADLQGVGQWKQVVSVIVVAFTSGIQHAILHTYVCMCLSWCVFQMQPWLAIQMVTSNSIAHPPSLYKYCYDYCMRCRWFVSCCCCASLQTVWPRPSDSQHTASIHRLFMHASHHFEVFLVSLCFHIYKIYIHFSFKSISPAPTHTLTFSHIHNTTSKRRLANCVQWFRSLLASFEGHFSCVNY